MSRFALEKGFELKLYRVGVLKLGSSVDIINFGLLEFLGVAKIHLLDVTLDVGSKEGPIVRWFLIGHFPTEISGFLVVFVQLGSDVVQLFRNASNIDASAA